MYVAKVVDAIARELTGTLASTDPLTTNATLPSVTGSSAAATLASNVICRASKRCIDESLRVARVGDGVASRVGQNTILEFPRREVAASGNFIVAAGFTGSRGGAVTELSRTSGG